MPFEVRPSRDREEFGRAVYAIGQYFGGPPSDEELDRFILLPLERMHAAFEEGEIVGGAGAFTFEFSVPGGSLPCAGVTVVGVYPTHRRRGVLRAMMHAQLGDVHERGEPIAALWASEETIYGRFGYGLASWCGEVTIHAEWNAFAPPLERRGQVRFVTPRRRSSSSRRCGMPRRASARACSRGRRRGGRPAAADPDEEKANPKRLVAARARRLAAGVRDLPHAARLRGRRLERRLEVIEAIGTTPQATAEIWRFLLDIDWIRDVRRVACCRSTIRSSCCSRIHGARGTGWATRCGCGSSTSAPRSPVARTPGRPSRLRRAGRRSARGMRAGGSSRAAPRCERTRRRTSRSTSARSASAYLGAVSFAQLRDALRLEELADGAVERADALFAWRPLPWCPEIF